jgi:hypothetical protein
VQYEAKWGHEEPCPRCVGRRHIRCRQCGGMHTKPLFQHVTRAYSGNAAEKRRRLRRPDLEVMEDAHGDLMRE